MDHVADAEKLIFTLLDQGLAMIPLVEAAADKGKLRDAEALARQVNGRLYAAEQLLSVYLVEAAADKGKLRDAEALARRVNGRLYAAEQLLSVYAMKMRQFRCTPTTSEKGGMNMETTASDYCMDGDTGCSKCGRPTYTWGTPLPGQTPPSPGAYDTRAGMHRTCTVCGWTVTQPGTVQGA